MRITTAPYRTPRSDLVATEAWTVLDGSGGELGESLDDWDYSTTLRIGRRIQVEVAEVAREVGLRPTTPLLVHVRTKSAASLIRTSAARVVLAADTAPVQVTAEIACRDLAGSLTIETLLELAEDTLDGQRFSPTYAGSILWRDEVTVVLEGDSGLLPVAPVSFSDAGLPSGAAWYLSLDSGRWDWTAMGSVLVLLNADNAAVATALRDPTTEHASVLLDTIEVDFVADLVGRAVEDESFMDPSVAPTEDDLSVGALVRALVRTRLADPGEPVAEAFVRLKELRGRDPSRYRALVQHGLSYPRSINR